jgi:hypothetical protein
VFKIQLFQRTYRPIEVLQKSTLDIVQIRDKRFLEVSSYELLSSDPQKAMQEARDIAETLLPAAYRVKAVKSERFTPLNILSHKGPVYNYHEENTDVESD